MCWFIIRVYGCFRGFLVCMSMQNSTDSAHQPCQAAHSTVRLPWDCSCHATTVQVRSHLQDVLSGHMLATSDVVALTTLQRDWVTLVASLQASTSWHLRESVWCEIRFWVVCLELEPPSSPPCCGTALIFVLLTCRMGEMLWHSYKCYKIGSSALQMRLDCQSNTLITGKINHVRNSDKSVSFLWAEISQVISMDFE